jgi:hypothetical protein
LVLSGSFGNQIIVAATLAVVYITAAIISYYGFNKKFGL